MVKIVAVCVSVCCIKYLELILALAQHFHNKLLNKFEINPWQ